MALNTFFRLLILSKKARQKLEEEADLQRRELDVVLKIAKLCKHEIKLPAQRSFYLMYEMPANASYIDLDARHPYSRKRHDGYYGLQDHLTGHGWIHNCDDVPGLGFPDWLVGASLEEAELRLEAMGVEV